MKILDCRAKEVLEIKRIGGDILLEFRDKRGISFVFSIELKRPYNKHWKAIEKLVKEIKTHLIERWDKSEIL